MGLNTQFSGAFMNSDHTRECQEPMLEREITSLFDGRASEKISGFSIAQFPLAGMTGDEHLLLG